jgi:hypothetical protein
MVVGCMVLVWLRGIHKEAIAYSPDFKGFVSKWQDS